MLAYSFCTSQEHLGCEKLNRMVIENAMAYIMENEPDFAFIYVGWVDEAGHKFGWLSPEYKESWKTIEGILGAISGEYEVIITVGHET